MVQGWSPMTRINSMRDDVKGQRPRSPGRSRWLSKSPLAVGGGILWRPHYKPHSLLLLRFCLPRAVSGVVRIDPLLFLAECRTRRLNQALSCPFFLAEDSFECVVLFIGASFHVVLFLCYFCVLSLGCSCYINHISVPVQVIDWKDSSPK